MTISANRAEHFNLYYIFEEDKKRHTLSKEAAADMWKNILLATKELDGITRAAPP